MTEEIEALKKRIRLCQPRPGAGDSERRANDKVREYLMRQLAELEAAALLEAKIRKQMGGKPVTIATLKAATIAAFEAFKTDDAYPQIIVRRDPDEANKLIIEGLDEVTADRLRRMVKL